MSSRTRRLSLLAGLGALGLLIPAADAATAAGTVEPGGVSEGLTSINLLNINDFHGRIDSDGTGALGKRLACTVETRKAALGESSTAFLSAGDNIGASPFTSSSQQDNPTLDYLNALGLQASAVGNHEFDRGWEDLAGRVKDKAVYPYLGANVYLTGSQIPAMKEYQLLEMGGLTVGVIGAVTEETPTLVSPAGVRDLSFGDPVDAVNRVAAQLSDGDDSNGEADVLVAEYHDGATEGVPDGATLADEIAAGGSFARIVDDTSAEVDAIFTGHTHKEYAWDAPIPGGEGTRPVLQAASYGSLVGQVELGIDPATGEVSEYSMSNVPLVETPTAACAADPEYTAAASIVDDAVATADEVGQEVVGSVTADITTAYSSDGKRDDRLRASALGNFTANVWREAMQEEGRPGADIGIMNPGGLRSDLRYDPSGSEKPGEVTYAEAAAINPFANTLMTTDLTGAQVVQLLEQQWQPEGSSRPYLGLGLSDNVTYTYDPEAAAGHHITSVWVDGQQIDPKAAYRIASGSFLISGGDNFTVLAEGTNARDTGLIDTDAFVDHLSEGPATPSHAMRGVAVEPLPGEVTAGQKVTMTVSGLDLTSAGSPHNTSLEVRLGKESLGTFDVADTTIAAPPFPVRDGRAEITVTIPKDATGDGPLRLLAAPSQTEVLVPISITSGEPTTPEPTDPEPTDPEPTKPEPTHPEPTEPGPTAPTDPGATDPGMTEPGPTEPTTGAHPSSTPAPTATARPSTGGDTAQGPVVETDDTSRAPVGAVGSALVLLLVAGLTAVAVVIRRRLTHRS